jgi:component factor B
MLPPPLQKASCERDAQYAPGYDKVKDISEVVTPRFLCTGGVDPYDDPNTCRGKIRVFFFGYATSS